MASHDDDFCDELWYGDPFRMSRHLDRMAFAQTLKFEHERFSEFAYCKSCEERISFSSMGVGEQEEFNNAVEGGQECFEFNCPRCTYPICYYLSE